MTASKIHIRYTVTQTNRKTWQLTGALLILSSTKDIYLIVFTCLIPNQMLKGADYIQYIAITFQTLLFKIF